MRCLPALHCSLVPKPPPPLGAPWRAPTTQHRQMPLKPATHSQHSINSSPPCGLAWLRLPALLSTARRAGTHRRPITPDHLPLSLLIHSGKALPPEPPTTFLFLPLLDPHSIVPRFARSVLSSGPSYSPLPAVPRDCLSPACIMATCLAPAHQTKQTPTASPLPKLFPSFQTPFLLSACLIHSVFRIWTIPVTVSAPQRRGITVCPGLT